MEKTMNDRFLGAVLLTLLAAELLHAGVAAALIASLIYWLVSTRR